MSIPQNVLFSELGRALLDRLMTATTNQLELLRQIELLTAKRRRQLEVHCFFRSTKRQAARLGAAAWSLRRRRGREEPSTCDAASSDLGSCLGSAKTDTTSVDEPAPLVGTVLTIAGSGDTNKSGSYKDGDVLSACFDSPCALVKMPDGSLMINDLYNQVICDRHYPMYDSEIELESN